MVCAFSSARAGWVPCCTTRSPCPKKEALLGLVYLGHVRGEVSYIHGRQMIILTLPFVSSLIDPRPILNKAVLDLFGFPVHSSSLRHKNLRKGNVGKCDWGQLCCTPAKQATLFCDPSWLLRLQCVIVSKGKVAGGNEVVRPPHPYKSRQSEDFHPQISCMNNFQFAFCNDKITLKERGKNVFKCFQNAWPLLSLNGLLKSLPLIINHSSRS